MVGPRPARPPSGTGAAVTGPILLVLPTIDRGGAERVFIDLAAGLAARGHAVHLAWASGDAELAGTLAPGITAHDLNRGRTAAAVRPLRRLVTALEPRAVISAMFHGNLLAAAATRARRARPALVFTQHGHLNILPATASRRMFRWSPRLVPFAYRAADAVVAVSAGVADDLVRIGRLPPSLVHHIPNAADFERIDRLALESPVDPSPTDDGRPLVVGVGRLVEVKGFDVLIRALAEVDPSVRLRLVGEGPQRPRLERLAADLGLLDRVTLVGALDNPYPELMAADLVVVSSRTESLSMVLVEAVHLRRPVVATDCSQGVREVLADGALGRLVPPGDVSALGGAIDEALAAGSASIPPEHAMGRYAQDEIAARFERLLDQVTADRR